MNLKKDNRGDENGFVLVLALLMLVMLSLLGIFGTTTSVFEQRVAANDKNAKHAFYRADGGLQVGIEMVEQNLSCPKGFQTSTTTIAGVDILDPDLAYVANIKGILGAGDDTVEDDIPSDSIRSLRIPENLASGLRSDDTLSHTNIAVYGVTKVQPGSALQMVAGYEGLGKSVAQGGSIIALDIHSQQLDKRNSKSRLMLTWRHVVGQEGTCRY